MARVPWTKAQQAQLRRRYPTTRAADLAADLGHTVTSVYQMAAKLKLRKAPEFYASPAAQRLDGQRGMGTRFQKGLAPWNKGMKGLDIGGQATRFKPGHRGGRALAVYQPIGAERISKDGYLQRKVNDDMPFQKRWKGVHVIVWEEAHGPVPRGHAVVFKNGDKRDIRIENLELVSRRELMARNTVHNLPKELAQVIQLRGALNRKINRLTRRTTDEQQHHR